MPKPTKTADELRAMVMDEVRKQPACANILSVGITRPSGNAWDTVIIRDGPHVTPECRKIIGEITQRICSQYDVADE